jgi:hypothetical protein
VILSAAMSPTGKVKMRRVEAEELDILWACLVRVRRRRRWWRRQAIRRVKICSEKAVMQERGQAKWARFARPPKLVLLPVRTLRMPGT